MISIESINSALGAAKLSDLRHQQIKADSDSSTKEFQISNEEIKESVLFFEERIKLEVLQLKLDLIPHEDHLYALADQLRDIPSINYSEYKKLLSSGFQIASSSSSRQIPRDLRKYFSANTFLTLPKDQHGNINTVELLKFIQKNIETEEVGLNLLRHCITEDNDAANGSAGWGVHGVSGDSGFISEAELERYIFEQIPRIHSCKNFQFSFYPFYSYAASRRFFFYLDPHRSRQIALNKLAHSNVMEDFVKMRRRYHPLNIHEKSDISSNGNTNFKNKLSAFEYRSNATSSFDEERALQTMYTNCWFHGSAVERIYNTYIDLDIDANGTLSEDELYHFSGMQPSDSLRLTRAAIRRLFEETVTYTPVEMDFKGFLDLTLALENKTSSESISYFWNIVNVDKSGRLSAHNIIYFYKEIYASLKEHGCDAPDPENIVVEIYDVLSCQDPRGPTLKDVIKSGQGHVVMSMLIDVTGFWQYDNRENLIAQQQATTQ